MRAGIEPRRFESLAERRHGEHDEEEKKRER
jgi:hypothetical protein